MSEALLPSPPDVALIPDAALVLDAQGLVRVSSPLAATLFAVEPDGLALSELIPAPERLWAAIAGARPGTTVPAIPLTGRRADGVPFALDVSVRVLPRAAVCCACCASSTATRQARSTPRSTRMPIGMALLQHRRRVRPRQRRAVRAARPRRRPSCSGRATRSSRTPTTARATSTPPGASSTARSTRWQCEKRFVRPDG